MGNGASFLASVSSKDKKALAKSREELAELFAKEYASMKKEGISDEDAKKIFMERLEQEETNMLTNIAAAEAASNILHTENGKSQEDSKQQFIENCERVALDIITKGAISYLFCTDGSQAADVGLRSALHLRRRHDKITVFHASKSYQSDGLKDNPATHEREIKAKYDPILIDLVPKDKYQYHFEERYARSVLRTLQDFLVNTKLHYFGPNATIPDFLVMGYVGVKGPKEVQTVLGSTTDMALRTLPIPCIICKKIAPVGPKSYTMAIKPGPHSRRGLEILFKIVGPRDTLRLIYLKMDPEQSSDSPTLKAFLSYFEEELANHGPVDSSVQVIEGGGYQSAVEGILDQVNGPHAPDFFALAPRAQETFTSVTEDIITRCRTNIILCKN